MTDLEELYGPDGPAWNSRHEYLALRDELEQCRQQLAALTECRDLVVDEREAWVAAATSARAKLAAAQEVIELARNVGMSTWRSAHIELRDAVAHYDAAQQEPATTPARAERPISRDSERGTASEHWWHRPEGLGPEIAQMTTVRYCPSDNEEHAANWGANRNPAGVLEAGREYTIERAEVHSWHTKVWLRDVGGPFNSVHFRAVEPATSAEGRAMSPTPESIEEMGKVVRDARARYDR